MSRYNPLSAEFSRLVFHMLVIGIPTVLIGMIADNYVSPLLIWGGTDCGAHTSGIESCVGYPPTGMILIGLAVGITLLYFFPD